ncbi:MAG: hypothetical protein V1729_05810, partial [Candidatus Woesearchaeota archaeon]
AATQVAYDSEANIIAGSGGQNKGDHFDYEGGSPTPDKSADDEDDSDSSSGGSGGGKGIPDSGPSEP